MLVKGAPGTIASAGMILISHYFFSGFTRGYLSLCMSVVYCSCLCVIHLATYHKPGVERGCDYCVPSLIIGKDDELLYMPPAAVLDLSAALDVSYISSSKPLTCLLLFNAGSFYPHISGLLQCRKYRIPLYIFSICWIVEWEHWMYFHLIPTHAAESVIYGSQGPVCHIWSVPWNRREGRGITSAAMALT